MRPSPARLRESWHREARRDRVAPWIADVIAWTPIIGTVLLGVVYLVSRPAYYAVLREDHPVEWLQFALLLYTAVLAALTAWRTRGSGWLVTALLLLLALGTFGLAGEEISWAQRALAYGTPEGLAAVNQQAELNVHNVEVAGLPLQSAFKLVSFVLAVAGLAAAWYTRGGAQSPSSAFWRTLAVPTYTMVGSLTMVGYWVLVVIAPLNPVVRYQEWAEVSLYLALAGTVYAIWRRTDDTVGSGAIRGGRAARAAVDRAPAIALVAVVALTLVLAALTAYHGIIPMNAREGLGG